jgi:hypothetical protein
MKVLRKEAPYQELLLLRSKMGGLGEDTNHCVDSG